MNRIKELSVVTLLVTAMVVPLAAHARNGNGPPQCAGNGSCSESENRSEAEAEAEASATGVGIGVGVGIGEGGSSESIAVGKGGSSESIAVSEGSSAIANGNGSGNTTTVDAGSSMSVGYSIKHRAAADSAYAPSLSSGDDTCMGSSSAGGQGVSFGFSFGTTWRDEDCVLRKDARFLHNLGQTEAALNLMCQKGTTRVALEETGYACPEEPEVDRGVVTGVNRPAKVSDNSHGSIPLGHGGIL